MGEERLMRERGSRGGCGVEVGGRVRDRRSGVRMTCAWMLIAATVVLAPMAQADDVTGNISVDTTWYRAGNPWTVATNVTVRQGATLTVEAGAIVEFTGNWLLTAEGSTGGAIVVQGAPYDSVYFRAQSGVSQWQGIYLSLNSASSFDYCVVLDAKTGLKLNTSDAPITHCAFRRCQTGIRCAKSSPAITSCWVSETALWGILCDGRGPPISQPVIYDCNLFDNAGYNVYLNDYAARVTIMAEWNWWGTTDRAEIEASIYDGNDTGGFSFVDYDPWRPQTVVEERTWGSIKALFSD